MGYFLIIPILALDLWLAFTVGPRALARIRAKKEYRKLALMIVIALALALIFPFVAQYNMGKTIRLISFPVPSGSLRSENDQWIPFTVRQPFLFLGQMANIITGLIVPLIPFKISEFLQTVKKELNG